MQTKLSRYCEGVLEAVWLAAVIIIPIFFNIYSSRIFEPEKVAIFRSLALLALCAWMIKIIEDGGVRWTIMKRSSSWIKTLFQIPMLAPVIGLGLVYLLATIFSISPGVSLWGSYQRLQGLYTTLSYLVLFFIIIANLRKWDQIDRLITTIIFASLPIALYGLLQRYGLDPIPWAGDTSTRIAANMGNSIFVAAYLIMVVPLTIGKLVLSIKKLMNQESHRVSYIIQATIYVFIATLQLVAIYLSQSRGPMLGLLVGVYLLVLLLSYSSPKRWVRIGVIGLALMGIGLLLSLNLDNGPLKNLRNLPGIGRYGMLLDSESTTALTRKYIWQGAVELVRVHSPLQYPDGSVDRYNFLRPLLGYGPESMYVAFNQFYPPELGHVEKRNASPDRSHNETWDALVTTGILGLIEYLLVFGCALFFGVKWVGIVRRARDTCLIVILMCLGGITGSVGFSLWRGIEYFGIGLPFGLVTGLLLYVFFIGLTSKDVIKLYDNNKHGIFLLVMILSAIVAHFIEINFGISIVATKMLFWIYVALMIVVGHILPAHAGRFTETEQKSLRYVSMDNGGYEPKAKSGKSPVIVQKRQNLPPSRSNWMVEMYMTGLLLGLVLITLSYDYIINTIQSTNVGTILRNSLTRLVSNENAFSIGMLGLFGITFFLGFLLYTTENKNILSKPDQWRAYSGSFAIACGMWAVFTVILAGKLAPLARAAPQNQYDVLAQVGDIGGLLRMYYLSIGIIIMIAAFIIGGRAPSRRSLGTTIGIMAAPLFFLLTILLVQLTNIRVINADIAFKMAEPFVKSNQWKMATLLYQRALELSPLEDHYYLFLGRSYLEQAKSAQTPEELDALIIRAEADLQVAQDINPLNTDHTVNLARLNNWWASRATDSETFYKRGNIASEYFETAVNLSPNNMTIWGEWAILNVQILNQPQKANELLAHAIEIDPEYSFTQGLMGDFYSLMADSENDPLSKITALEQAAKYYQEAVNVHNRRDTIKKSTYLRTLGNIYRELAEISDLDTSIAYYQNAIDAYEEALDSDLSVNELWIVRETLAQLFVKIGDKQMALFYAESALENAPDDDIERIRALIYAINAMP